MNNYERIAQIKAELQYINNQKDFLYAHKQILEKLEKQLNIKQQQLLKENEDVEQLQNSTILSLFYSLTGQMDKKMEKEKQEAMQASIEYHQILNEYNMRKSEIEKLEKALENKPYLNQELQQLQLIIQQDNPHYNKEFKNITNKIEEYNQELKKTETSLHAGKQVKNSIEDVLKFLTKAENWGFYDIIAGKKISTAIKYSYYEEAQRAIVAAKTKLLVFGEEMRGYGDIPLWIETIGETLMLFDYINDQSVADYIVQRKIERCFHNTEVSYEKLCRYMEHLKQQKASIEYEIDKYNILLEELLVKF